MNSRSPFFIGLVFVGAAFSIMTSASAREIADCDWALRIANKSFDRNTGLLSLSIENRGARAVTAFEVAVIDAGSRGGGSTILQGSDTVDTAGLAPGHSREVLIALGQTDSESLGTRARSARLHFEIRSDNSSCGDWGGVNRIFEMRAATLEVTTSILEEIGAKTTGDTVPEDVRALLITRVAQGRDARRALISPNEQELGRSDRARLLAQMTVGDLVGQTVRKIEIGWAPGLALRELVQVLSNQRDVLRRNVRPNDVAEGLQ